ncbi:MAG: hypothetical protein ACYSUF_02870 [Planctomycetota bacterium]|jgi:hypothetical protein
MNKATTLGAAVIAAAVVAQYAAAEPITDPSFFDASEPVWIDFETFPGSGEVIPVDTLFTDEFSSLGVVFSSEDQPHTYQTTDPEDTAGRFEYEWVTLGDMGINGAPTSGVRMASGRIFSGINTSDMRLDFSPAAVPRGQSQGPEGPSLPGGPDRAAA